MGIIYSKSEGEKVNNKCKSTINSVKGEIGNQNLKISMALAFFNTCDGKGIESAKKYLRLYMDNNIRYKMSLDKLASSINEVHSDFNGISSESKVDVPKWEKVIENLKTIVEKNEKSIEDLNSKALISNVAFATLLEAQNNAFTDIKTKREYWIKEAKNSDSKKISAIKSSAFDFMFVEDNFKNLADVVAEDGSIKKNSRDYFTKIESNNNYFAAKEEYGLSDDDIVNLSNSGVMPKDIAEGYSAAETDADKKMLGGFLKRDFDKAFDVDPNEMSESMKNYRNKFITNYINSNKDRVSEFDGKEVKGGDVLNLINGLSYTSGDENYAKSNELRHLYEYVSSSKELSRKSDKVYPLILAENTLYMASNIANFRDMDDYKYIYAENNKNDVMYENCIGKGIIISSINTEKLDSGKQKNFFCNYIVKVSFKEKFETEYYMNKQKLNDKVKESNSYNANIYIGNPDNKNCVAGLNDKKNDERYTTNQKNYNKQFEGSFNDNLSNVLKDFANTPAAASSMGTINDMYREDKELEKNMVNEERLKEADDSVEKRNKYLIQDNNKNGSYYLYYNDVFNSIYTSGILIK